MSIFNEEIVTVTIREYLSVELAEKIAASIWGLPQIDGLRWFQYEGKTETDYFNVVAQNGSGEVLGRLCCIQNDIDSKLWYYGDLFVVEKYRRRHIAEKMLSVALESLKDRGCEIIRSYIESENTPSLDLQRKLGFTQKPYLPFNNLINDGRIMFEKKLSSVYEAVIAQSKNDARYIVRFYGKNIDKLHGQEITYNEWCRLISEKDPDEEHFLICRGVMPVGWLKINGLDETDIGFISMLAVEPCFQHKGVGTFAVKFTEAFLLAKGKKKIGVQTTADNVSALSLYKKCSFKEVERYTATADDNTEAVKVKFIKNM